MTTDEFEDYIYALIEEFLASCDRGEEIALVEWYSALAKFEAGRNDDK